MLHCKKRYFRLANGAVILSFDKKMLQLRKGRETVQEVPIKPGSIPGEGDIVTVMVIYNPTSVLTVGLKIYMYVITLFFPVH